MIGERGRPEKLRLDNGPEFTSRRMLGWPEDWKAGWFSSSPAGRHRTGASGRVSERQLFGTLNEVRSVLASWRRDDNCERPHNSPREFKIFFEVERAMPGSIRQPQSTQLRASSYEWLSCRGQVSSAD
jgi:hypothetical protein